MNAILEREFTAVLERQHAAQLETEKSVKERELSRSHTLHQFIERLRIVREHELEFKKAYTRILQLELDRKRNRI